MKSTFKDISSNYVINKVETTLSSATLYIDELNATIAIDKKDLGISSFSREEILIDQIPDVSNIKCAIPHPFFLMTDAAVGAVPAYLLLPHVTNSIMPYDCLFIC